MHRYQVVSQLGDGSFGVVNKAIHTTTGEVVAVKKMKQRFGSWEECLQLREIQSLRRLQHTNIIKLKEVVRENTELFMIFEFMEMNVYQITRMRSDQVGNVQNIFNDKEVRCIMCQTLLGLAAIHKGGFMHRDLKRENLLKKRDSVKIADFGLAKEIRSRPPFTEYVSTRWYRAPEIILRSTHYNSPIDMWACGVIFAELYLNRPLFPGASDTDQLFKICSILGPPNPSEWDEGYQLARRLNIRFPPMAPTPLRQIIPNAPPTAIDLIEQMLRFNPSDRPTCTMALQHPYFTGHNLQHDEHASGFQQHNTVSGSGLYQGISSGQPHSPFQWAQNGMQTAAFTSQPPPAAQQPTPQQGAYISNPNSVMQQQGRYPLTNPNNGGHAGSGGMQQLTNSSSHLGSSVVQPRYGVVPQLSQSSSYLNQCNNNSGAAVIGKPLLTER